MASPRITKTMRDGIVRNTIDTQFGKDVAALKKREVALAERVYKEQYTPKQVAAMEELGAKFVTYNNYSCVNVNGKSINLYFTDSKPVANGACYSRFSPSAKLTTDIEVYIDDKMELDASVRKAEVALYAMLESVVSFKKLRAIWPDGEKFYDMYDVDSETKAGVPAVVVTELNKLLGIK